MDKIKLKSINTNHKKSVKLINLYDTIVIQFKKKLIDSLQPYIEFIGSMSKYYQSNYYFNYYTFHNSMRTKRPSKLFIDDGFQNQDDYRQQSLMLRSKISVQSPSRIRIREEVKLKIPPANQLKNKAFYSLRPDIQTGWVPRVLQPNPIPIIYKNSVLDKILQQLLNPQTKQIFKISYLGPRFENTYYLHYGKQYPFPYNHIKRPITIKYTNRSFLGQNKSVSGLKFQSHYESGNLDCVVKISENEYDLFILVDTNTKGHMQWYNFKVRGGKKGQKYIFHICNFQKAKSLYSRGMKPYIFSKKKSEIMKIQWEQAGNNLKFQHKPLRYQFLSHHNQHRHHRLSFEYTFQYQDDEVQFAYCVPYQYTYLLKFIEQLISRNKKYNCNFIKVTKLSNSLSSLEVPLLTIHQQQQNKSKNKPNQNKTNQQQQKVKKKCIIISGRAHPGQSNGSFMMHGFLQFICGFSPFAMYLRKRIVFKIIPMLNPDGVVAGNYRTGVSGRDFNRQFLKPDHSIFPENWNLKDLIKKCKQEFGNNLLMFLDFHGHSIKKNVFMYGPQFPITDKYYYLTKIFPKLVSIKSDMFRFYSCIFKVSRYKQSTARAVVLHKLDIPFSYTIEASNGSYHDDKNMKDISFNPKLWIQMGTQIGFTIYDYCFGLITSQQQKIQKLNEKKMRSQNKNNGRARFIEKTRLSNLKCTNTFSKNLMILDSAQLQHSVDDPVMDHSKFKNVMDEIKREEQNKSKNRVTCSDDEISEGNSDSEQQADDLTPNDIKKLYNFIKAKKLVDDVDEVKFDFRNDQLEDVKEEKLQQIIYSQGQNQEKESLPTISNTTKFTKANRQSRERDTVRSTQNRQIKFFNGIDLQKKQISKQVYKPTPTLKVNNLSFLTAPNSIKLKQTPKSKTKYNTEKFFSNQQQRKISSYTPILDNLKHNDQTPHQKPTISTKLHFLTFFSKKLDSQSSNKAYIEKRKSINIRQLPYQ